MFYLVYNKEETCLVLDTECLKNWDIAYSLSITATRLLLWLIILQILILIKVLIMIISLLNKKKQLTWKENLL
jgi:hypothetical protein